MRFLCILISSFVLVCLGQFPAYTADTNLSSRTFEFNYSVSINEFPKEAKLLDLWIPVPQSDTHQDIFDLKVESDFPYTIHTDPEYGNKMAYVRVEKDMPDNFKMTLSCKVTRKAVSAPENSVLKDKLRQRFLQPDKLVPIDGKIETEVTKATTETKVNTDQEKARAFYDYIVETVDYDKSGEGWGKGDAIYACDVRKGNCTDFHSLFIGMARSTSIPARFIIGFPLPADKTSGEIKGYHCWAEFYIEGKGWTAIDASEAYKHPEKREFFFGNLDANRVQFTIGRDIFLQPDNVTSERLNYFIYPHVLVNGKPFSDVEKHFTFTDLQK